MSVVYVSYLNSSPSVSSDEGRDTLPLSASITLIIDGDESQDSLLVIQRILWFPASASDLEEHTDQEG